MHLDVPTLQNLKECYDLECFYEYDAPSASAEGFFLPGTQFSLYENLLETGYIREIRTPENGLIAYIMAVPPQHDILKRLFSSSGMKIEPPMGLIPSPNNTIWIAKIATGQNYKRQGLARKLYETLFRDYKNALILTATALNPKHNAASENFHKAMDFTKAGTYSGEKSDTKEKTENILWIRPATILKE